MKALVTGAAGFIGGHLVRTLLEDGWDVVGIDNLDDYYSGKILPGADSTHGDRFKFVKADILDLDSIKAEMQGVDVVAHMAAQAGVRFSVRDPLKSHMVNVVGTLNVLIAALESGAKRMVNSSSSSIYGNSTNQRPTRETDRPAPVSPYATSKLAAEIYCRQFYDLYGLDTVSLRYFTVYGPRQRPDMAIRIFTDRIMKGLPPQIFGDGEQTRDFTYVDDAVRGIKSAMTAPALKGASINIAGGRTITVNRLVNELLTICGRNDLVPEHLPPKAGDVDHTWGNISTAKRLLGWEPTVGIEEGLRNFVSWYRVSTGDLSVAGDEAEADGTRHELLVSRPLITP
ncbi:MAG: GDP-mannose 4,6-dehydratase [Methanomassiliicoccus sp.]|nr:GDP-mannose 4,6-dehydratase [Methanomassiliicoccus sp.]